MTYETMHSGVLFAMLWMAGLLIGSTLTPAPPKQPQSASLCETTETDGEVFKLDKYGDVASILIPSVNEIWPLGRQVPCKWLNRHVNT